VGSSAKHPPGGQCWPAEEQHSPAANGMDDWMRACTCRRNWQRSTTWRGNHPMDETLYARMRGWLGEAAPGRYARADGPARLHLTTDEQMARRSHYHQFLQHMQKEMRCGKSRRQGRADAEAAGAMSECVGLGQRERRSGHASGLSTPPKMG
jgi:hypothetical protein